MGLLDDAIRDHLELKRRRGADPDELERAEREALGPVHRDPFERAGDESELAPAAHDQQAEDLHEDGHQPDSDRSSQYVEDEDAPYEQPARARPTVEAAQAADIGALRDEEAEPPPPHPAGAGAETVEYDIDGLAAEPHHQRDEAPGVPEDDDVLEETPEFLQDTPDHDRLWFEQRPPRDFDFDG